MRTNTLPNFFVMGAQKSATTSLQYYLQAHPEIYLPEQKETKFFADESIFQKGIDYYKSEYFSRVGDERAIGEIDPDYMFFENAIKNMSQYIDLKKTRLIFILRNPAERAFSHYVMTRCKRGIEPLDFEEAIRCEAGRIENDWKSLMHYSYVSRGFYLKQIERIVEYVPKENMLFILTEELKENPKNTVNSICRFIGVSDVIDEDILRQEFHKGVNLRSVWFRQWLGKETRIKKVMRNLFPEKAVREQLLRKLMRINETDKQKIVFEDITRLELLGTYKEENIRLGEFINRDLSSWMKQE